jgi:hypothetical protein
MPAEAELLGEHAVPDERQKPDFVRPLAGG